MYVLYEFRSNCIFEYFGFKHIPTFLPKKNCIVPQHSMFCTFKYKNVYNNKAQYLSVGL